MSAVAMMPRVVVLAGVLFSAVADAHSFSMPYILPIPLWIYLYGCIATLLATFVILGVIGSSPVERGVTDGDPRTAERNVAAPRHFGVRVTRAVCVFLLLLAVCSGLIGSQDPAHNIGMTLFWVMFLLGLGYLSAVIGDVYSVLNPWRTLAEWAEKGGVDLSRERVRYPEWLGAWPAVVLYMALIWIELFAEQQPLILSKLLLLYSAITLIGMALFGQERWFSCADVFTAYFSLIGKLAPVVYERHASSDRVSVRLRAPLSSLVEERPTHPAGVLFVLFMLSSTAYDALYDTQLWTALFWRNAMVLFQALANGDLAAAQETLMSAFLWYRKLGLLVLPFLYLAFYFVALILAKRLAASSLSLRSLSLSFCYSLIPIALAYNFSHYFTFVLAQLGAMPGLLSDPFGFGWNLLAIQPADAALLQVGWIWHTQVLAILAGHVAGVVVTHRVARRLFDSRRKVVASQLPLLVLMVGYTMFGLWILTLPLG